MERTARSRRRIADSPIGSKTGGPGAGGFGQHQLEPIIWSTAAMTLTTTSIASEASSATKISRYILQQCAHNTHYYQQFLIVMFILGENVA